MIQALKSVPPCRPSAQRWEVADRRSQWKLLEGIVALSLFAHLIPAPRFVESS
jgi:predicted exporter